MRVGQRMRHPDVDQPRLLAPGDDFDREAQRAFCADQELGRILGDPQGVGRHRAHLMRGKIGQPFAKAAQGRGAAPLGRHIEVFFARQAGRQTHRIFQTIERVDLVIDDAPDLQAETVGTQINGGDQFIGHGAATRMQDFQRNNPRILALEAPPAGLDCHPRRHGGVT